MSNSMIFYRTSKSIVGLQGDIRNRISVDELMAYGVPRVAEAASQHKTFEYMGIVFVPEVDQLERPTVPVPIVESQRSRLWDVALTAAFAAIFTALGLWGGVRLAVNRSPCAPVLAQPTCDESTGVCR